ncbi:MAG: twin-arginine translocation signal domain-containing protein [Cyclobacteriaceae bacterium]|nr:twin-arginine translocation signal domain-containing protein [Cyclobacteriaceae bacterium]
MTYSRRTFVKTAGIGSAALASSPVISLAKAALANTVEVINPLNRVPLSFIIDDSTPLVNMAHFGIPQFAEVFPENYKQDWRSLPREIPDSFVREFGEWCHENGVKGKYSIVPYPACTGWVNRFIPGWSKSELQDSLQLVRDLMMPDWDIHPEMISHTRAIDIKTGRPFPTASADFMENWGFSQTKSADELAAYQAYALQILKDVGLPCEGITTPGGYGSQNRDNLARGTMEAVRDVFGAEVPHYFRDLFTEKGKSVAPVVKLASDLDSNDPKCVVSVIGCTGDWFGGWDGLTPGDADKFITEDLSSGRMVDVIESGEPAIMVCHWPGIYYNGEKKGFNIFKTVVSRLHKKYDHLLWMKNSEIARYWAAKELTAFTSSKGKISIKAPFGTPRFTIRVTDKVRQPRMVHNGETTPLQRISDGKALKANTWYKDGSSTVLSFDLAKGASELLL